MDTSGHELYFAHQRAVQTIHGVVVPYQLALIGPWIDVVHSELDPTLPPHSIPVRVVDAELMVDSAEWVAAKYLRSSQ